MERKAWGIGAVVLAALILAPFASRALSKRDLRREDTQAAVSVSVTYLNPLRTTRGDTLDFEVRMNTHSVDLDGYQMEKLSHLRDDRGRSFKPLGWFDPGGGGHHRFGVLKFAPRDGEGKPILGPGTKYIELVIRDVANVPERVLRWELPLRKR